MASYGGAANMMIVDDRRYEIVVAMDFSDLSDRALEQAIALSTHHEDVILHVISVGSAAHNEVRLPGSTGTTQHATDHVKAHVLEELEKYKRNHGPCELKQVIAYVAIGDPAEKIVGLAKAVDADVIVLGSRGRQGVDRLLRRSVAEEVMREAECGVYVVHERTKRPPERSVPPPPPEFEVVLDL